MGLDRCCSETRPVEERRSLRALVKMYEFYHILLKLLHLLIETEMYRDEICHSVLTEELIGLSIWCNLKDAPWVETLCRFIWWLRPKAFYFNCWFFLLHLLWLWSFKGAMDNQNVSTSLHCVKFYIYIWDGPEDVEDFVFDWKKKKTTLTKHWISHSVDRLVYEHWSLACMLPPWNQFLTITELHLDSLHHLQRSALQVKKKEVPQQRRE